MSDYIRTSSGVKFYPLNPDPQGILIEDIAHALSLLCRGNGHVKVFFSVGQHCIHCAKEAEQRGYSTRLILACLLHDASEAYLSDITRPVKQHLQDYCRYEEHLLEVIYKKFLGSPLSQEEQKLVKIIDDDMLYYDLRDLLNEFVNKSGNDSVGELVNKSVSGQEPKTAPIMYSSFSYKERSFKEVEEEYLSLFRKYSDALLQGSEKIKGIL